MPQRKTIGYIPTIEGKPAVWCYDQLCYCARGFPADMLPTLAAVKQQIAASKEFRKARNFSDSKFKYSYVRVATAEGR